MNARERGPVPRQTTGPVGYVEEFVACRDVVFLVADAGIRAMVAGFFSGAKAPAHILLGDCAPIAFDPHLDIVPAQGNDPGVWKSSREYLRRKEPTHRRAVVILDNDWDGSPGPERIRADISADLAGWEQHAVIVIEPELEAWFWRDHPGLWDLMLWKEKYGQTPRKVLEQANLWPSDADKPPRPKEAIAYLRKRYRINVENATFGRVAAQLSVLHCKDIAFLQLATTLREWFPADSPMTSSSETISVETG